MNTSESLNLDSIIDGKQASPQRVAELCAEQRRRVCANTDRLFMWLMILQWIVGIVVAIVVSPRTWIGDTPHVHMHVYLAVLFGALISVPTAYLAWRYPGSRQTRITIAIAQAAWSCVLIQLTGGRIETNFHAFGSLAFLAFYREWRLLIINTGILFVVHVLRGSLWPMSVYSVAVDSAFQIFEHALWLTWINLFLVKSCVQQLAEERRGCERQAELEQTNTVIEHRIQKRTMELATANRQLQVEFAEHQKTQEQREVAFRELAEASRRAGMAEVATGVLHNVGNVLNSVNVSTNLLLSGNRKSRVSVLAKASDIVSKNRPRLAEFLTSDKRGRQFPAVLQQLTGELLAEQEKRQTELESLQTNLRHINEVIDFQQSFAKGRAVVEQFSICALVDDALKINAVHEDQNRFRTKRDFGTVPLIKTDKHKVLQILVNLISNARHALVDSSRSDGLLTVSVKLVNDTLRVDVSDNGVGIAAEDLDQVFVHGFTTKESGHGFGLHSSALAAQAIGGALSVQSRGPGQGATFTLTFPINTNELSWTT